MTSTRLPGKILMEVAGKAMLDYHLDRIQQVGVPVFVATTVNRADDPTAAFCEQRGISFYRGDELDVLSRFYELAVREELEVIIRVTSDCPLIDPQLVRDGLDRYLAENDVRLYCSNGRVATFPRGMDFEIFSFELLQEAMEQADQQHEREHVTPYLYQGRTETRFLDIVQEEDKAALRLTLDTPQDFELLATLLENKATRHQSCAELVAFLEANPQLTAINAGVNQKHLPTPD